MTSLADTARSLLALCETEKDYAYRSQNYLDATSHETIASLCRAYLDAERDAERYKWIRNNPNWIGFDHDFMPTEVDRAVDRAKESR